MKSWFTPRYTLISKMVYADNVGHFHTQTLMWSYSKETYSMTGVDYRLGCVRVHMDRDDLLELAATHIETMYDPPSGSDHTSLTYHAYRYRWMLPLIRDKNLELLMMEPNFEHIVDAMSSL